MRSSHRFQSVPVNEVLTRVSSLLALSSCFALSVPMNASALNFPFQATYTNAGTSTTLGFEAPFSVSVTSFTGSNVNAPYGLVSLSGVVYSRLNQLTGELTLNTDPTLFGLSASPPGSIVLETNDGDRLFGTSASSGNFDFSTLTATFAGIFTITGGTGRFQGATGTIPFSEVDQVGLNSTVTGVVTLDGSFQVPSVPEPGSSFAFLALALSGALSLHLGKRG